MTGHEQTDRAPQESPSTDRVILLTVSTEFEAHAIVAVLVNAGIEATAIDAAHAGAGAPLGHGPNRVPIQIDRGDLAHARETLEASFEDSVDIDWDGVDLGEREDDLPLTPAGAMPTAARVAFLVTAAVVLLAAFLAVLSFVIA